MHIRIHSVAINTCKAVVVRCSVLNRYFVFVLFVMFVVRRFNISSSQRDVAIMENGVRKLEK